MAELRMQILGLAAARKPLLGQQRGSESGQHHIGHLKSAAVASDWLWLFECQLEQR